MQITQLLTELTYRTARSSGPGGQHVNKVETKVDVLFEVATSAAFGELEKARLLEFYKNQITTEGLLITTDQSTRSQLTNKEKAIKKLIKLIEKGIKPIVKRKIPDVPFFVKESRSKEKNHRSEIKAGRKKPTFPFTD
jgi:ribosome-associated protein